MSVSHSKLDLSYGRCLSQMLQYLDMSIRRPNVHICHSWMFSMSATSKSNYPEFRPNALCRQCVVGCCPQLSDSMSSIIAHIRCLFPITHHSPITSYHLTHHISLLSDHSSGRTSLTLLKPCLITGMLMSSLISVHLAYFISLVSLIFLMSSDSLPSSLCHLPSPISHIPSTLCLSISPPASQGIQLRREDMLQTCVLQCYRHGAIHCLLMLTVCGSRARL